MTAHYTLQNNIAVITLNNPPVNSMGIVTRTAIAEGVAKAITDASVAAIVIVGANGIFTGGADIREFGLPVGMQSPNLHDLIRAFEASPKPIISGCRSKDRSSQSITGISHKLGLDWRPSIDRSKNRRGRRSWRVPVPA